PVRIVRASDFPAGGWAIHASPEQAAEAREALIAAGAVPIGEATLDALRVEDGRPWYGRDVTEDNLLHETGLVAEYHSPAKGCYVGQEVIARLEARGAHVNKVLRGLRLQAPVEAGAVVHAEGKDVGVVTTSGVSPRLGPIAMAFVHRSRAEAGTVVEVAGAPATVTILPITGRAASCRVVSPAVAWGTLLPREDLHQGRRRRRDRPHRRLARVQGRPAGDRLW